MSKYKKVIGLPLTEVSLDVIKITPLYQRGQEDNHIAGITRDLEEEQFTPPTLILRGDGTLWAVDGQQRIEAAKRSGYTHVMAIVINAEGRGVAWEAKLFVDLNTNSKRVSAPHLHRARKVWGEPIAVHIEEVLAEFDLTAMPDEPIERRVLSVSALRDCWTGDSPEALAYGDEVLRWVIGMLKPRTYGHKMKETFFSDCINALSWMYRHAPEGALNEAAIKKFLVNVEFDALKRTLAGSNSARQAGSGKWYGVNLGRALGMEWVQEYTVQETQRGLAS